MDPKTGTTEEEQRFWDEVFRVSFAQTFDVEEAANDADSALRRRRDLPVAVGRKEAA